MDKIISISIDESNIQYHNTFQSSGCTINGVQYYTISQYCTNKGYFQGTIRNWLRKLPPCNYRDFFITIDNKIYVTESIALLQNPDFISKKTPNGDLVPFLTKYEWDLWASVRFGHKFQLLTVGQKIKNLYSHIQKKFKNIEIRLFFVTETNPDLTGYHAHFLFWTDSPLKTEIRSCIENYLRGRKDVDKANTRIEKYIMNGGAIQYMLKETTKNKDGYDFLWNKYDEKFA